MHYAIRYPGIARVVWERSAGIRAVPRVDAGKPCGAYVCGLFPPPKTRRGIAFDHRNDHRQRNFQKAKIKYPGVAQLVARVVWDHQAAGSNPVTRTKNPLKSSISEDFLCKKFKFRMWSKQFFSVPGTAYFIDYCSAEFAPVCVTSTLCCKSGELELYLN